MASITVVVDCSAGMSNLKRTLGSLADQSFGDFTVVTVCPDGGSPKASRALPDGDGRFAIESDLLAPRDVIAKHRAESYLFATCGTTYPQQALEKIYGSLVTRAADVVVSRGDLRWFDCREQFVSTYRGKAVIDLPRRRSFNQLESTSPGNLACSRHLLNYVPTDNKIFSGRILEKHIDKAEDFSMASRWLLTVCCSLEAEAVYGLDAQGCVCRQLIPSCTRLASEQELARFTAVFEATGRALSTLAIRTDGETASVDDGYALMREKLARKVHNEQLCALIEVWSYWYWEMDDGTRTACEDLMRDLAESAPERIVGQRFYDRRDLFDVFLSLRARRHLEVRPAVSFVIMPGTSKKDAQAHLSRLKRQECPYIEVLIPSSAKWAEQLASANALARIVEHRGEQLGPWMTDLACNRVNTQYVVFLQDKIYWTSMSVTRSLRHLETGDFDCLVARPAGKKAGDLHVFRYALPSVADSHVKEPLHELDDSLNNKMIRVSAIRSKRFTFSDNPFSCSQAIRKELVCRPFPSVRLLCHEEDELFVQRAPLQHRWRYHAVRRRDEKAEGKALEKTRRAEAKTAQVRNQVLFTTNRMTGSLTPHLQGVYDATDGEKLVMAQTYPHTAAYREKLKAELMRSKTIITDDYIHEIVDVQLQPEQRLFQLWHAIGAFKKFGLDCFGMSIAHEKACHEQYTNVFVSSEGVRSIYAQALGIDERRVLALGCPSTDRLLDASFPAESQSALSSRFPEIGGKRVIAYCPTFRQEFRKVVPWNPAIDWTAFDEALREMNAVLLVKPHPLDDRTFLELSSNPYNSIKFVDHFETDALIAASDLLVTDYSSIVFDAMLMRKPFLLYCPDYESYQRDFYLDFPADLPATMTRSCEELLSEMRGSENTADNPAYDEIRETYLSACDGHSTARIAAFINGSLAE